eukprot:10644155-Alexandrium_andersonii.AAC.1
MVSIRSRFSGSTRPPSAQGRPRRGARAARSSAGAEGGARLLQDVREVAFEEFNQPPGALTEPLAPPAQAARTRRCGARRLCRRLDRQADAPKGVFAPLQLSEKDGLVPK